MKKVGKREMPANHLPESENKSRLRGHKEMEAHSILRVDNLASLTDKAAKNLLYSTFFLHFRTHEATPPFSAKRPQRNCYGGRGRVADRPRKSPQCRAEGVSFLNGTRIGREQTEVRLIPPREVMPRSKMQCKVTQNRDRYQAF